MRLEDFSGERRVELVALGRLWGSDTVKAQAERSLGALTEHGEVMLRRGVSKQDIAELQALVDGYPPEIAGREDKQLGGTLTSRAYQAATAAGRAARREGRALLEVAANRMPSDPTTGSAGPRARVEVTLTQTARQPPKADAGALASQLRLIGDALTLPEVEAVVQARGGDAVVTRLKTARAALEAADTALKSRTPTNAQTEALDLRDGLIVERLRELAKLAKAAAKAEGQPTLAAAFKLTLLYT